MLHKQRFTLEKIKKRLELIEPLIHRKSEGIRPFRYISLPDETTPPPIQPNVDDSDWAVIEPGSYWGEWRTNFVLRSQFQIPADWAGEQVAVTLPLGNAGEWFGHPEALVFVDGSPHAGCDRFHQEIWLDSAWNDGQPHTLALHGWTGNGVDEFTKLLMHPCELVIIDQPTRDFVALARVTLNVVEHLEKGHPAHSHLLNGLDAAFHTLDTREPFGDPFYESVPAATAILREHITRAGAPIDATVTAAGHAHIDVAWLWTLAQTRRKAGRTFHTVMRLMEEFPDYHFTQSQPQLYDYVRQDYPALFEEIKERVKNGRWEPIGGMWVEADCNISGGESLARQFLLGRAFFREHFGEGVDSPVLWLPDVFGYAWNLPQLIKQAGLEYFFTIKIGWNQYNKMPYDTFWWQGLDGTQILTHFSTVKKPGKRGGDYNAVATPDVLLEGWRSFPHKETSRHLLMAYGHGDGGGGPTREMQENLNELAAFPAMPRVRRGKVADFFKDTERDGRVYKTGTEPGAVRSAGGFPTWNGELYFELHRGTYTTQARNKRANRQSEFLLHDAEFLAAYAAVIREPLSVNREPSPVSRKPSSVSRKPIADHGLRTTDHGLRTTDYEYPHAQLTRAWQLVCLNQFHDIIPGSSITEVYEDSLADYAEVRRIAAEVQEVALAALAEAAGSNALAINPTSFTRSDLVFWADGDVARVPDTVTYQEVDGGLLLDVGEIRPYSLIPLNNLSTATIGKLTVSPTLLQNDFLRVELNEAGDITRIFDRQHQREILPSGAIANQWQAFEDRPLNWDAWDIDIFYDDKMWLAEAAATITVIESGPLRATIQIERRILNSSYTQRISLSHNSARLDFETTIDWRERHMLLKTAFPVDVLSPTATYEIQWGNVERPTHRNTSWDWARFETAAQKWVDLSEGGYGVSMLNDCKYGHDIQDGQIRLTLLRSPTHPDPEADQGQHQFTYSLLPHSGRWGEETIQQAYALNDSLRVYACQLEQTGAAPLSLDSLVSVDQPNVVIETVKQAEDGNGLIVRLYECMRQRGEVTLRCGVGITATSTKPVQSLSKYSVQAVYITNLLEENETKLPHDGSSVTFPIKPYEIVTLRIVPAYEI